MLVPVRTVAPAVAVVSTTEAKAHLRVDHADEDTFIDALVAAATERLEGPNGILGQALVNQTWRQDFDAFDDCLLLPLAPVSSITSVKYYDADNVLQTVSSGDYSLLTDGGGSYIEFVSTFTVPTIYERTDAVQVTFVAGYGAAGSNVPAPLRAAILLMVGDLYANRESVQVGSVASSIPMSTTIDALIGPYRKITV